MQNCYIRDNPESEVSLHEAEQLTEIIEIANTGSFSQAARNL